MGYQKQIELVRYLKKKNISPIKTKLTFWIKNDTAILINNLGQTFLLTLEGHDELLKTFKVIECAIIPCSLSCGCIIRTQTVFRSKINLHKDLAESNRQKINYCDIFIGSEAGDSLIVRLNL